MTTIFDATSGTTSNWLASAESDIQASESLTGGMLGALGNATSTKYVPGSIAEFLNNSDTSNALALISQNTTSNAVTLTLQTAQQVQQQLQAARLKTVQDQLTAIANQVKPTNTLDSTIYFNDGTTIDTQNNIMTMPNGTQIDTTTGALYNDPASIVQMANGAYLNTKTNIMTMGDGTQIDITTGQKVSVTT